ncbi:MAG: type II toxin-antitoxin system VapC family toxin [Proteobacteria bacterium]|nr:type II toxin-antitoxin system VapC family toxin [Pseudomonadota bacterium]
MILVDSFGWIEYFLDGPLAGRYAKYLEKPAQVLTPAVVIYEVYKKIKRERGERGALEAVAQMRNTRIVSFSERIALSAADFSLQSGLPMADAMVYATAMSEGCQIVSSDPHFKNLPGVIFLAGPRG